MTVVAAVAAGDVVRVFTRCCKAVMAGAACAHDLDVVDGVDGRERVGVMAVFADIGRRNVRRVLADRIRAVVAARTTIDDIRVIEVRRRPANRRVTVVAGIAGGQVGRVLARCGNAIMTGAAGTDDLGMVHGEYRCEHVCRMAVLANIAGLNVRQMLAGGLGAVVAAGAVVAVVAARDVRRMFARRGDAVVAGATGSENLRVVYCGNRLEGDRAMAILADIGRLDVRWPLSHCGGAVMAPHAIPGDANVIEHGRQPGCHGVAVLALIVGRNGGWRLAGRLYAVVTSHAAAGHG